MFQRVVSADPRRGDDARFQQQLQVLFPRQRVGDERMRQQSRMNRLHQQQSQPHRRAGERAEKQNRRHSVRPHRVFGAEIVEAEKKRGQQNGDNPVHSKAGRVNLPRPESELLRGEMLGLAFGQ